MLLAVFILSLMNGVLQAAPRFNLVEVGPGSLKPFWIDAAKNEKGVVLPLLPQKIEKFKIMDTAVTNRDFIDFLSADSSWKKSKVAPILADRNYLAQFKDDETLNIGVSPDAPVTGVSWFAAKAYCENHGMRLPTTLEWEFAGIASEKKKDAGTDQKFLSRILEWYSKPNASSLPSVKSTYQNVYGVYDMHGLIWEWVEDFNSNMVTGESREDSSLNRNLFCGAGGLNGGNKSNYAAFMRFAFRSSLKGKSTVWNLGFRCVK